MAPYFRLMAGTILFEAANFDVQLLGCIISRYERLLFIIIILLFSSWLLLLILRVLVADPRNLLENDVDACFEAGHLLLDGTAHAGARETDRAADVDGQL